MNIDEYLQAGSETILQVASRRGEPNTMRRVTILQRAGRVLFVC